MTTASSIMAFLHHLLAFALVAAIGVHVALFKPPFTVAQARRIQRTDIIYGATAGLLLVVGFLRVFFFEKGAGYYFSNTFFIAKIVLFLIVGLISVYPTSVFLYWSGALKEQRVPEIEPTQYRRMRMCLMWELTGVVLILLCAVLMADGWGYFGKIS